VIEIEPLFAGVPHELDPQSELLLRPGEGFLYRFNRSEVTEQKSRRTTLTNALK
jgi:hypothetical protein